MVDFLRLFCFSSCVSSICRTGIRLLTSLLRSELRRPVGVYDQSPNWRFGGKGAELGPVMTQMLLFPDPRPLVERLGLDFFRQAPQCAGVYLMRDAADTVLYVGKAKNLRKRLGSYRVANPDRMPRRHLRLLRAVARIELQECADEAAALVREAELLRHLRPRFNRAGTWPGLLRYLRWRVSGAGLELGVGPAAEIGWQSLGPSGVAAFHLRAALVRLLWCAIHPERGLGGMPEGWFDGRHAEVATISRPDVPAGVFQEWGLGLGEMLAGQGDEFTEWIKERTSMQKLPFEIAVREADLETVTEFVSRQLERAKATEVAGRAPLINTPLERGVEPVGVVGNCFNSFQGVEWAVDESR